jgi:epoxyqueuosine reductase
MIDRLTGELKRLGFHTRVVPVRHLAELGRAIEDQHGQGFFDEGFFQERLTGFGFGPPEALPHATSLIAVGYADPHVRFTFTWEGERIPVIVPATYLHFLERDKRTRETIEAVLTPEGYSVVEARVPKKLLAVRSGLARYGRNNITYCGEMGSYYRLAALFSDMPCEASDWHEPKVLEMCEDCMACVQACPTGAIDSRRFLLRAELCISFWNEQPKEVPFPEWIDPAWHNCLVGCLHCQRVCPENREVSEVLEEGEEFSEDETGLLLEGRTASDLPSGLVGKLEKADLLEALDTLPRNLGVLLRKHRA